MKICLNGSFYAAAAPLFAAQNRSFKWGDGLFETMKVSNGRVPLSHLHFERLFLSMKLLQIETDENFTQQNLLRNVMELAQQNNCTSSARVRLAIYRNHDNIAEYLIECNPLANDVNNWNDTGLSIAIYPYARKSLDAFANLKSANFLPYVLAGRHAKENGVDDAIVLNAHNNLCDSSKANIFLIKDGEVFTPALHQGCINGVMRRRVTEVIKELGVRLHQSSVSEQDLRQADEVFLTNAIQIIRWVKQYNHHTYTCLQTRKIFEAVKATIFSASC